MVNSTLEEDSQIEVTSICQQTLAYALATDEEKGLLERMFKKIGERAVAKNTDTDNEKLFIRYVGH